MRIFNSAREYHEKTKYSYDDVKFVYREFSPEPQPLSYKDYPGKPVIQLPKNFDLNTKNLSESFSDIKNINEFRKLKESPLNLQQLSQLLYLTNGVTLVRNFPNQKVLLRAAPSASALYPVEIYIMANNVQDIDAGLYYFQPNKHQLIRIEEEKDDENIIQTAFDLNLLKNAPVQIIFTSMFSRSSWKFKKRAYRYCIMDAGYLGQNLVLSSASLGLTTNLIADFADAEMNQILGIDGSSEAAIILAAIGEDAGAIDKESYTFYMEKPENDIIDENLKSLVRSVHLLSSHYLQKEEMVSIKVNLPFKKSFDTKPSETPINLPKPKFDFKQKTHQIIEERRSSHNFVRIALTQQNLSEILHSIRQVPVLYNFPAHNTYVVVNDVGGLENGAYKYHPDLHAIEILRKGTYRGDISYLTLAQDAVFNCSAAIFFSTDFEEINLFSNRGYRYAHFNVGMYSEAIYLVSTALDIGVRGIGNFFDDSLNTFFRVTEPNENILGGVIIGRF